MFIEGIGLSGYRSFGGDLQVIGPFSRINLFVGQNNSGKSNILRFLAHHYPVVVRAIQGKNRYNFQAVDLHLEEGHGSISVALALKLSGERYSTLRSELPSSRAPFLDRLLKSKSFSQDAEIAWFQYVWTELEPIFELSLQGISSETKPEQVLNIGQWRELGLALHQVGRPPEDPSHMIRSLLKLNDQKLLDYTLRMFTEKIGFGVPRVTLIPAFREIGEQGSNGKSWNGIQFIGDEFTGSGIIEALAELQHPDYDKQDLKDKFEEINCFLREVTGNQTATLEIPHAHDKIMVDMDGRVLPLNSLGTGIHEVIILASAAMILEEQVICIEEPELHLHALLQKKLIRYLQEKTKNQYFITTHSVHFSGAPETAIFHVRYQDGHTIVTRAYSDADKSEICADLGYRASDLLQANCVIWVEGPSDRIYLNHWIHTVDSGLVEGLHYSIMFYGGRLLSHLTADDPEVEDFISLRRLNRNISIVIDSDRGGPEEEINETKKRIRGEFDDGPGFAWITKGREIENYIETSILVETVKKVHPTATGLVKTELYDNCLKCYMTADGPSKGGADKVKVAREVVHLKPNLDFLDLKQMVTRLVEFIHQSND